MQTTLDPLARAAAHPLIGGRPAVDFFEGPVLGNGGLGVVIRTRPDAVVAHFGHNNVWDIRVSEKNREKLGTFREVFEKVQALPAGLPTLEADPWYREYSQMAAENYAQRYPRPMPCGSLVLGFDRRRAELTGHRLDIATGLCEIRFLVGGERQLLRVFVDQTTDQLVAAMVDATGLPIPAPFDRIRLLPDARGAAGIPPYTAAGDDEAGLLSFRQVLPYQEPDVYAPAIGHPKDRAFRLAVRAGAPLRQERRVDWHGNRVEMDALERAPTQDAPFVVFARLDEGLADGLPDGLPVGDRALPEAGPAAFERTLAGSRRTWADYWRRSGVVLEDKVLERIWYHNLYFLACAVRPGVTCPGLFANWSYQDIGTAWHSDYHMNYNTQQPFWATFSSNHVDRHLPYVDLVHHLLPVSRRWAAEYYELSGAYFPHSAYPVDMTMMPYPVPTWGWEICETPWTVQSLWWHYLYTMDRAFLEERAFGPIREAVVFLVDYMSRPEAYGPQWGDGAYHIFPTVPPELYGLRPGFDRNHDCIVDLTLTKFVYKAYLEACRILGREDEEAGLRDRVQDILAHFPAYPTAESPRGRVFVSVPGEHVEMVQNTPNTLMAVFPGEDIGLDSPPEQRQIAADTYRQQRNEGGNELVFLNLQAARLGLLDLEKFKREAAYCRMPNGTYTDLCLQVHGRYQDDVPPFDFMARMGIWLENFALPVVINECLLQSYSGTLRLFPNWPAGQHAALPHTTRSRRLFGQQRAGKRPGGLDRGVQRGRIDTAPGQSMARPGRDPRRRDRVDRGR